MTEPSSVDKVLGFLRTLSKYDGISEEGREAAEECRQILLLCRRDRDPDDPRLQKQIADRFTENWDSFAEDLIEYEDVTCELTTFTFDGNMLEMDVHLDGKLP